MAYAVQADLEAYFGDEYLLIAADREGADDLTDATVIAVITAGITAATEEIDSYLAVRFDLPLAATPGVLNRVCMDMSVYHMSVGRASMDEGKKDRHAAAVKWLEKLSKGTVTLGEEEEDVVIQDEVEIATTSEPRLFTRTKMSGLL